MRGQGLELFSQSEPTSRHLEKRRCASGWELSVRLDTIRSSVFRSSGYGVDNPQRDSWKRMRSLRNALLRIRKSYVDKNPRRFL
jgi:hypothetical protein